MHSVKNTAIAMILLGVSFTLYHISLNPSEKGETSLTETHPPTDLRQQEYDLSNLPPAEAPPLIGSGKLPQLSSPILDSSQTPNPKANDSPPSTRSDDFIVRQKSDLDRDQGLIAALNSQSDFNPTKPPQADVQPAPQIDHQSSLPSAPSAAAVEPSASSDFSGNPFANSSNNPSSSQNLAIQNPPESPEPFKPAASSLAADAESNSAKQNDFDPNSFAPINKPDRSASSSSDFLPMQANAIGSTTLTDPETHSQASASASAPSFGGLGEPKLNTEASEVSLKNLSYSTVWEEVDRWIAAGRFRMALQALSQFYDDDSLSGPQRQRLIGWLDALAAKVIFSTEDHLSDGPYTTQPTDTLEQLSANWQVPSQLIANINQENLGGQSQLRPGVQLKQIKGPFQAQLELEAGVMTLFLDGLYAGRFAVTIGTSGQPRPGTYEVIVKSEEGYTWRDAEGRDYPPQSPENGYGPHWMGLSGSLCIHAVPASTKDGHRGCIGLTPQDAADLFVILSEGSTVTILP